LTFFFPPGKILLFPFRKGAVMVEADIPGRGVLRIENAVFDYNGTLAAGGVMSDAVRAALARAAEKVSVHVVTADTFGTVQAASWPPAVEVAVIGPEAQAEKKRDIVRRLGAETCAACGNGANDVLMLEEAALGICVIGPEGACGGALRAADIAVTDPLHALDLLLHPRRITATLRK